MADGKGVRGHRAQQVHLDEASAWGDFVGQVPQAKAEALAAASGIDVATVQAGLYQLAAMTPVFRFDRPPVTVDLATISARCAVLTGITDFGSC